jgi:hypothetical protein
MKGMTIACPCASADDLSFDRVSGRPVSISICRSAGERKQSTARPVVRAHDVRAPVYCTDCIYGDRLIAHAARVRRVQPRVYSARYCKNFKRITQSRANFEGNVSDTARVRQSRVHAPGVCVWAVGGAWAEKAEARFCPFFPYVPQFFLGLCLSDHIAR